MGKTIRKLAIALAGGAVVLFGLIMIPLPGPGIPIVIAGIALLALEFPWAARARDRARELWTRIRPAASASK